MNILLVSQRLGCSRCLHIGRRGLAALLLALFLVLPALSIYGGYRLGLHENRETVLASTDMQGELERQRALVEEAKRNAEENLNALTLRMGQMQAQVMRLDALGQRLTRMAGLEGGEFNFDSPPAVGGPEVNTALQSAQTTDFMALLDNLAQQMEDRGKQLGILETALLNHNLQAEVIPSGRPVEGGWISSSFGTRTDPFTGRPEHHAGIDIAGREGTEILAVASGVITWAGERYGYGNLVEINHGKGYVTRYGHNKEILVKVGDTVKKGQTLALMGSSGRSTGTHLHFEVLRNGRAVNPARYLTAAR